MSDTTTANAITTLVRTVDAHVHHWDPARPDLYPYLGDVPTLQAMSGLEDVSPIRRAYDRDTLLAEARNWKLAAYVHVSCAMGADVSYVAETRERAEHAEREGGPAAIIGSVHASASPEEIVDELAAQAECSRFRGVRVNMGIDHRSPQARALLRELEDRNLSYELWTHPADMEIAADVLAAYPRLTVVVGHMGWPLEETAEHRALWERGLTTLATLGERVHCKLSGLAQTLHRLDDAAFRPWIDTAVDIFGDERCFFGSNFPVDGSVGTYNDLYAVYDRVTAHRSAESRDRLFAANAERFYRI